MRNLSGFVDAVPFEVSNPILRERGEGRRNEVERILDLEMRRNACWIYEGAFVYIERERYWLPILVLSHSDRWGRVFCYWWFVIVYRFLYHRNSPILFFFFFLESTLIKKIKLKGKLSSSNGYFTKR